MQNKSLFNGRRKKRPSAQKGRNNEQKNMLVGLLVVIGITYFLLMFLNSIERPPKELTYKQFYNLVEENKSSNKIIAATLIDDRVEGKFSDGRKFVVNIPKDDADIVKLMRTNLPDFNVKRPQTLIANLFYSLGPMVLFILFLWFFIYRGAADGGRRVLSFGKSKAKLAEKNKLKVTFEDVAGVDEAKAELQEVIDFLKDPRKFQKLGGKMPKGILVVGPPGTGKTLLAKAVAGEADVPFFSISGSDFVEMFVGVGASRVRDLFEQAKKSVKITKKGSIIFIDEIDAVGRQRFAGIGGGHDEREQTLNALLAEMDGFDTREGIILIAATNRPDVLDQALLRPGRFDRHIVVDRPDILGREAILKVHAKRIKLSKDADLQKIAQQTAGFSGAELANLINEAALLGARRNKESVQMRELQDAMERVLAGPERRSRKITDKDKKITACHESGHALMTYFVPDVDPLHKVTIIPRGISGGYTMQLQKEDRFYYSKTQLIGIIKCLLGGRAAEEVFLGQVSTGASDDIKRATELARDMVTQYGMSDRLGHLTFGKRHEQVFLGRDLTEERNYSEHTAQIIDGEIKDIVESCYAEAKGILENNKGKLEALMTALLEKETLEEKDVRRIIGFGASEENKEEENKKNSSLEQHGEEVKKNELPAKDS